MEKLYCFGPSNSGPNLLLIDCLKPQYSLYKKYALIEEDRTKKTEGDSQFDIP